MDELSLKVLRYRYPWHVSNKAGKGLPENRAGPKDSFGGEWPAGGRFFPA